MERSSENIDKLAKAVFSGWSRREIEDFCINELTWIYEQDPDLFQEAWDKKFGEQKNEKA